MKDTNNPSNLLGNNHISISPDHHSKNPFLINFTESKKSTL